MSLLNVSWGYKWDPYKRPSPSSSGTDALPCPAAPAGTALVHMIQPCTEVASSHSQTLLKRLHPSFFHSKIRYFSYFAFIYPLHGSRKLLCFVSTHTRKAVHVPAGRGGGRPTGTSTVVSLLFSTREPQEHHRSKREEIIRLSDAEPLHVTAQVVSLHIRKKKKQQQVN